MAGALPPRQTSAQLLSAARGPTDPTAPAGASSCVGQGWVPPVRLAGGGQIGAALGRMHMRRGAAHAGRTCALRVSSAAFISRAPLARRRPSGCALRSAPRCVASPSLRTPRAATWRPKSLPLRTTPALLRRRPQARRALFRLPARQWRRNWQRTPPGLGDRNAAGAEQPARRGRGRCGPESPASGARPDGGAGCRVGHGRGGRGGRPSSAGGRPAAPRRRW